MIYFEFGGEMQVVDLPEDHTLWGHEHHMRARRLEIPYYGNPILVPKNNYMYSILPESND